MIVRGVLRLQRFVEIHPDATGAVDRWLVLVRAQQWQTPADIKAFDARASVLKAGRVVFNISGNRYRLIAAIDYPRGIVLVIWIGKHDDYDRIDANTVS